MHVCSAPVENRRGQWLAATAYFVEGRDLSKRGPLAQGQTGAEWGEKASEFDHGFRGWHG